MNTNLQKIKELIQKSDLSLFEQEELILLFTKASDQDLEPTLELFAENPSWIRKISDNYKAKQSALATKNSALWQKIIQEEESQLKELEQ
ncbi:MAG: hypothetical protein ABH808_01160 [Candidatus Kuenenbacteria bacterium]